MSSMPKALTLLHRLLRLVGPHEASRQLILGQFRRHRVTSETTCKAEMEMRHLANNALVYFQSQRDWQEVHQTYHAKGERSIEQAANVVGLKLPESEGGSNNKNNNKP